MLKGEHKLVVTELKPIPLSAGHMPEAAPGQAVVAIRHISHPDRVNRLSKASELAFANSGLTIIYGDNGSGKSGYVRVLKAACRVKGADSILPNVFDATSGTGPASAAIEYQVVGEEQPRSTIWKSGEASPPELSQIGVFDSKSASIYVDNFNELKAVPHSLDCFEKLAAVCDKLKARLESELRALRNVTSIPVIALPAGTPAKAFVDALGGKTPAAVEAFATHTEQKNERIKELGRLLEDPKERLREVTLVLNAANTVKDTITEAQSQLTKEFATALRTAKTQLKAAQDAMEIAAKGDMSDLTELPGVGSMTWRLLFEAARDYSEAEAYPEEPFPVIADDARCVLCQQTLEEAAKTRFTRFQAFIEDAAAKAVDQASEAWSALLAGFRKAAGQVSALSVQIELIKTRHVDAATKIADWVAVAEQCKSDIEKHIIGDESGAVTAFPESIAIHLEGLASGLENAKVEAAKAASGEPMVAATSELSALKALKQFSENKVQILARVSQHGTISKLEKAIRACSTTSISNQGKALLKEYVTDALANRLQTERENLGVDHIPLSLLSIGEKGTAKHKVQLAAHGFQGVTSQVLSEGEHRAMALAVFLAEHRVQHAISPIVIDDPVSSLDHQRIGRVARRLVREAKDRQVIVFTHDLFFFTTAQHECALQQVPLRRMAVLVWGTDTGVPDPDGDPWVARSLPRRVDWLEGQLAKAKKARAEGNPDDYASHAQNFYFRLRPTWERLIEEVLFAGVVLRFRLGIETTRLADVVVDDDLFKMISDGMTVTSAYAAHDTALGPNVPWPEPDEMAVHLQALKDCLARIKAKSGTARKARDAMAKAPVA